MQIPTRFHPNQEIEKQKEEEIEKDVSTNFWKNRHRFVERSYDAIIVYWKIIILLKLLKENKRGDEGVEVCDVEN